MCTLGLVVYIIIAWRRKVSDILHKSFRPATRCRDKCFPLQTTYLLLTALHSIHNTEAKFSYNTKSKMYLPEEKKSSFNQSQLLYLKCLKCILHFFLSLNKIFQDFFRHFKYKIEVVVTSYFSVNSNCTFKCLAVRVIYFLKQHS